MGRNATAVQNVTVACSLLLRSSENHQHILLTLAHLQDLADANASNGFITVQKIGHIKEERLKSAPGLKFITLDQHPGSS